MAQIEWTFGFDADDTLWHNERFFRSSEAEFAALLGDYAERDYLHNHLMEAQTRNLAKYGFGAKGFTLSMIESAIEVTQNRVDAQTITKIINLGKELLSFDLELLPGAAEALAAMSERGDVVLITKGDLLDQERKLAASGLGEMFRAIEIVSDKTPATYERIFARHGAAQSLMVGNSLKSDVIPALESGHWGVYVPHEISWSYEHAPEPLAHPRYRKIETLEGLSALVDSL